jgi:hypothetical protein
MKPGEAPEPVGVDVVRQSIISLIIEGINQSDKDHISTVNDIKDAAKGYMEDYRACCALYNLKTIRGMRNFALKRWDMSEEEFKLNFLEE